MPATLLYEGIPLQLENGEWRSSDALLAQVLTVITEALTLDCDPGDPLYDLGVAEGVSRELGGGLTLLGYGEAQAWVD